MLGRLNLQALHQDAIEMGAGAMIVGGALFVIALLFYLRRWTWLWKEWLTSLDPKRIGIMYLVVSMVMLVKGFIDALMMRAQQVFSVGDCHGYLSSSHFQQLFTAHGATMIFFVAMGLLFGLLNFIIPLQIGARDVAFPFVNAVSFWLFAVGAMLLLLSLIVGKFAGTGWVAYPPLSELQYNPGVGVDYWLWSVQISGAGSLISGINFLVTILKMRCPGMTLMKMPMLVWTVFATSILIIFAFQVLTATLTMLSFDRLLGMHFFTSDFGGNPMMYINLIWAWGHPEVYILVLPAFGIFSEVVATFSQKRLFGYASMVWATVAIMLLSFGVWLHHFFTMGAGPNANSFFGIMTMLIAVPTGVKIFNWLFTMYQGRVRFTTPMIWFLGFLFAFTTGGMTGVLMSIPAVDFQMHNSLFLIAHFHSTIIGGVVFGFFAGLTYWFPKITGFTLNERLGKYAAWCWIIGFFVAFFPLYILGMMGATRRLDHYESGQGWQPLFITAAIGALIIAIGIGFQFLQLWVSFKQRKQNQDVTGDPWNGRTLEWSTASPPPEYNFAHIPEVKERDAFWAMKQAGDKPQTPKYEEIHVPKNSPLGFLVGVFAFLLSFGVIWYMWWLAIIGMIGIIVCVIIRLSDDHTETTISAREVETIETAWQNQ